MNYLAHLYLSCENEEWLVGNFLADFLKNKEIEGLPLGIQQGIQLHRKIDSYTDSHEIVKQGTALLHPYHHKYAPVVLDIFYDFLLIKNWDTFHESEVQTFANQVYEILLRHLEAMPERLHRRVLSMVSHNWLPSYGTEAGLAYTFKRVAERLSRPDHLDGIMKTLKNHEKELNQGFLQFFPEAVDYVKGECACL